MFFFFSLNLKYDSSKIKNIYSLGLLSIITNKINNWLRILQFLLSFQFIARHIAPLQVLYYIWKCVWKKKLKHNIWQGCIIAELHVKITGSSKILNFNLRWICSSLGEINHWCDHLYHQLSHHYSTKNRLVKAGNGITSEKAEFAWKKSIIKLEIVRFYQKCRRKGIIESQVIWQNRLSGKNNEISMNRKIILIFTKTQDPTLLNGWKKPTKAFIITSNPGKLQYY